MNFAKRLKSLLMTLLSVILSAAGTGAVVALTSNEFQALMNDIPGYLSHYGLPASVVGVTVVFIAAVVNELLRLLANYRQIKAIERSKKAHGYSAKAATKDLDLY